MSVLNVSFLSSGVYRVPLEVTSWVALENNLKISNLSRCKHTKFRNKLTCDSVTERASWSLTPFWRSAAKSEHCIKKTQTNTPKYKLNGGQAVRMELCHGACPVMSRWLSKFSCIQPASKAPYLHSFSKNLDIDLEQKLSWVSFLDSYIYVQAPRVVYKERRHFIHSFTVII